MIACQAGAATVAVAGSLDCTGYALINITVTARTALAAAGVRLVVPTNPTSAFFAMGLGQAGGLMEEWVKPQSRAPQPSDGAAAGGNGTRAWKWDGQNGNNAVWFGSTKAGVRVELKGVRHTIPPYLHTTPKVRFFKMAPTILI